MDVVKSVRRSVPAGDRGRFSRMIRDYYGELAHNLGWASKAGESADVKLLRPEVLELVASLGEDQELAQEAKRLAIAWLKDRKAVQPELAAAVLDVAAYHGNRDLFDDFVAEAKRSKAAKDRARLIDAMGEFRDPELTRRAYGMMLTNDLDVRELTRLLQKTPANPETECVPWEFVTTNYNQLVPRLPSRLGTDPASILPTTGASFCDDAGYRQVEEFFRDRIGTVSGGARVLANVLEKIQLCEARRRTQAPEVAKYLQQFTD